MCQVLYVSFITFANSSVLALLPHFIGEKTITHPTYETQKSEFSVSPAAFSENKFKQMGLAQHLPIVNYVSLNLALSTPPP